MTTHQDKQEDNEESIESIVAEIRRSSIENKDGMVSIDSKDSDTKTVADDSKDESSGRLAKGMATGNLTPRRGRSALASLKPSPANVHGRGHGDRVTRGQI